MIINREFDYRNSIAIIDSTNPGLVSSIRSILTSQTFNLNFNVPDGKQLNLSKQVQNLFVANQWQKEVSSITVPSMRYDLKKNNIPIEIELGHERLVFADFFEFMADYSTMNIPAAIMIVTGDPTKFKHKNYCSIASTERKIKAIQSIYQVPTWVIGVDP
ncbi:BglII/BstYI family type II restriction endonuclease [Comamonas thiooxydans]|uniref:BglII/BstYI family type II restriction endonuclease n=1 Tax=Comamonas thiooxydans TaxID=363952 RepID=UPI0013DB325B|nr:BglII/BstYI family type II restriction endonuclease [Comamonas thiooxydans]